MIAIITVCVCLILMLVLAFFLYLNGYIKEAILIRNGVYGMILFYISLVLFIGLIPAGEI